MRLGVFADLVYRRSGQTISTDLNFIQFIAGLAGEIDELVVFGRLDPEPGRGPYVLPAEGVRFVPLPYYRRVTSAGQVLRSTRTAGRVFAAELDRLDAVWLFGPHPWSFAFALAARRRDKLVVLGVRQEYGSYIANRLPSRRWLWAVPVAHGLERAYRLLGRRLPAVVVGEKLGRMYGAGRAPVLATGFSLVRAADLVTLEEALARSWEGDLRLLSVGRIDSEKNPLLMVEVLAALRERSPRWRLTVAGDGPLVEALGERARELGVGDALDLAGHVRHGHELTKLYRSHLAFLHVSLTEGVPQVLFEAQAAGLPIVATDVGGVREALGGGSGGLLIPPRDRDGAVRALERLRDDEGLRGNLIRTGLEQVSEETTERQLERLKRFLEAGMP